MWSLKSNFVNNLNESEIANLELRPATSEEISEQRQTWLGWLVSFPYRSMERVYATSKFVFDRFNLAKTFSDANQNDKLLSQVKLLSDTYFIATNDSLIEKVLQRSRNEDTKEGVFRGGFTEEVLQLFKKLFPEDEIGPNDFIFTASPHHVSKYRRLITNYIGYQKIADRAQNIHLIVKGEISRWETICQKNGGKVDITKETKIFACSLICKLIFGHPGPYEKIAEAIDGFNQIILKQSLPVDTLSAAEKEQLKTLRGTVDSIFKIANDTETMIGLSNKSMKEGENQLSDIQKKIMVLTILLAGQETTAAVLNNVIWELARSQNRAYQDQIYKEMIDNKFKFSQPQNLKEISTLENTMNEALLQLPAAFILLRKFFRDSTCEIETHQGETRKIFFEKGSLVISCPFLKAKKYQEKTGGKDFNPTRFKQYPSKNDPLNEWLPFGKGAEICPGQWLAREEIRQVIGWLAYNYVISTEQEADVGKEAFFSMKLVNDKIEISMTPRNAKNS